jgi:2-polyprenyl-6-methoxyphenol hydroxylase-like FAD-dependent oxidoreductase
MQSFDDRWNVNFGGVEAPETFDIVVGADGAWSRIRQVLTGVKPCYSGVHCITLIFRASPRGQNSPSWLEMAIILLAAMGKPLWRKEGDL